MVIISFLSYATLLYPRTYACFRFYIVGLVGYSSTLQEKIQNGKPGFEANSSDCDDILLTRTSSHKCLDTWQPHSFPTFQSNRSRAISSLGFLSLAAATIPSPRGPHPLTTTTSSNCTSPRSTAWMEHASGSINTPFQGGMDLGTWEERREGKRGGRR